ncbi:peptidase inhibitor I9 [Lasiosphaeris hirsuta]|uniref:Peptidase inhibitor I9 n=1 Tax=Lasiosphaeris hirsuta TaxID=260670 RepID=A0AA40AH20_9PEZI|nr:peptidase inhibitor I9 [Lasiosphaeris hirsuta]
MPSYIVTLKNDATDDQIKAAKEDAVKQGGKIGHEYTLIKAFQVIFPEDSVTTFEKHENVKEIEKDAEVKIQ